MALDNYDIIVDHASHVNNYLLTRVRGVIIEVIGKDIKLVYNTEYNTTDFALAMQFYYNNDTNRCFIEFDFNSLFRTTYSRYMDIIKKRIKNVIYDQFKDDMKINPELIFPEDGTYEGCDSNTYLSPYTIGYWKSVRGEYEFITDRIKTLLDYNALVFPKYDDEYITKKNALIDEYYRSDLETFSKKMYELTLEYNIDLDFKPRKDFNKYIQDLAALNNLYYEGNQGPNTKLIPEMFEEFKTIYKEFFEKDLSDFEFIHKDDYPDDIEIWKEIGDYDFGDLDEGTDPESIAIGDFYYNRAAEYCVLRVNYDIEII